MTIINTALGQIQGEYKAGLYLFKGIKYAQAKRFEAPQPYIWKGVFNATSFSKKAPQIEKGDIQLKNISEDCLTLNIYTPSLNQKLPVLVEIHGGAFQTGSNQSMNPWHVIGKDEFIYITINYRLGVLGYLDLDGYPTSGNNGTLDQLAALNWIKEHIENFGGDPSRITLLGSSAGAKAIGALMNHESSSDLFSQAILISGAYQSVRSIATAEVVTKRFLDIIGVSASDLASLPLFDLLTAQQQLCEGNSTCLLGPVSDGVVISKDFYEAYHEGRYWKGKALLGCSLHELIYYEWMDQDFVNHAPSICKELFGNKQEVALKEVETLTSLPIEKAYTKVIADGMYRTYTYKMAKTLRRQGNIVYQYGLHLNPACHVLDHVLALSPKEKFHHFFKEEDQFNTAIELGKQIRNAYVSFVINGEG